MDDPDGGMTDELERTNIPARPGASFLRGFRSSARQNCSPIASEMGHADQLLGLTTRWSPLTVR
jgi:hypothetical protein